MEATVGDGEVAGGVGGEFEVMGDGKDDGGGGSGDAKRVAI